MKNHSVDSLPRVVAVGVFFGVVCVACSKPVPVSTTAAGNPVQSGTGGVSGTGSAGSTGSGPIILPDASIVETGGTMAVDASSAVATGDANCGSIQSKLQKRPVDLLIVLDRSTSMNWAMNSDEECPANSTTCAQRWSTIASSLTKVLNSSPAELYWGLKFFTSPLSGGKRDGTCYVSNTIDVPVEAGNASKIQTQIATAGTANTTPTRAAIDYATTYLKSVNDGNDKFILLATDGEPNCANGIAYTDDLARTTTAVANAAAAGFKVFVLGVGTEVANLTNLAKVGGTDKFYSATTPDELSTALSTIVGTVAAGCTYTLPSVPVSPNAVGVYIDKSMIPQDASQGWTYGSGSETSIVINGKHCDDLKSGTKTLVEIFLPCKPSDSIPTVIF